VIFYHQDEHAKVRIISVIIGSFFIDMDAGKEQAALQEQQEHIKEPRQMPNRILDGMVPEGMDRGPGEQVAILFSSEGTDLFGNCTCFVNVFDNIY